MLDLNLEICKTVNTNCNSTVDEESGTSHSSIISNPDDQENNSAFIFEILKKENLENPNQELNTQQFFPAKSDLKCGLAMKRAQQNQWLKLWSCEGELKNVQQKQQQMKKSRRGPRSRSSEYIGVTFYRRTGRWESHIWDCGKQLYLGGFDTAFSAARAYDRAAIKFRGVDANINFTLSDYEEDMKQTRDLGKEEFVQILRRQCSGSARGGSKYKGVTLHKYGRWDARLAQFQGKKGCNGREAVTEFESGASRVQNLDLSLGIAISGNNLQENYRNVGIVASSGTKSPQILNSLPLSGKLPGYQG